MSKLVRDKIPDLIRASGRTPHVSVLPPSTHRDALIDKLHEEAEELRAARTRETVIGEAADVLEVLSAIVAEQGATVATIGEVARLKREKRGGFAMRLLLESVDPAPGEP